MYLQSFNLDAALAMLVRGLYAIVGHICFDAGLYGLGMAALTAFAGLITRSTRYGLPLLMASRKLALLCSILVAPGALIMAVTHHLPPTGAFNVSPLAFMVFWSWIGLHLAAEQFNFEFF